MFLKGGSGHSKAKRNTAMTMLMIWTMGALTMMLTKNLADGGGLWFV